MSIYQEQTYKEGLRAFTLAAEHPVAVAVLFHGGGWVGGTPLQFAALSQDLAAQHISSISLEYRLFNTHRSSVYDSIADALDAAGFVRDWAGGLPLVLIGASAGALLAFHLALNGGLDVAATVLLNPALDVSPTGFVSKATPRGGDAAISALHMPFESFPPSLILHGNNDQVIPLAVSETFTEILRAKGIEADFEIAKPAGHGFWGLPQHRAHVTARIIDFIHRHAAVAAARTPAFQPE